VGGRESLERDLSLHNDVLFSLLTVCQLVMNRHLGTVLVAPMTTKTHKYPTRVACRFQAKTGEIVLDQIRVADRSRLVRRLGRINPATQEGVLGLLSEMFAPRAV
jgi:mRNA interferase MazF